MILWEKMVHNNVSDEAVQKFVALTSTNAAKIYNMYPEKGRLEVGSQADIVIWDPAGTKTISVGDHNLKTDFNVFNGQVVHGVPETVIMRGRIIVDEGQLRAMQGFGLFIPVAPYPPEVYEKIRAREAAAREASAVIRANPPVASNGNSVEDVPPPTPKKSEHAEKAPSQHESSFDLRAHPNDEVAAAETQRASVRVRAPPGGRSSGGFW